VVLAVLVVFFLKVVVVLLGQLRTIATLFPTPAPSLELDIAVFMRAVVLVAYCLKLVEPITVSR
jgi:hypothetical protein